jgi:surface antigen
MPQFAPDGKPYLARALRASSGLAIAIAAAAIAGCSVVVPIGPLADADVDATPTGSIARPASPLVDTLDAEDWRRAAAALDVALDPQGAGAPVAWSNPLSRRAGRFAPAGHAYPAGDGICRRFEAEVTGPEGAIRLAGEGCRGKDGAWRVRDVAPRRG